MTDKDVAKMLEEEAERIEREDHLEEPTRRYVRPRPSRDTFKIYSIRIEARKLEELRKIAEQRGVPPTVLMRWWVLDRLDTEREASVLTVRLAPPVYEQVTSAAEWAGLSIDEFVTQAVVVLAGKCDAPSDQPGKRRPGA